jgi:hypothetical protein
MLDSILKEESEATGTIWNRKRSMYAENTAPGSEMKTSQSNQKEDDVGNA